jgi:hypothetical protein
MKELLVLLVEDQLHAGEVNLHIQDRLFGSRSPLATQLSPGLLLAERGTLVHSPSKVERRPSTTQGNGGKVVRIRAPPQSGVFPFATRLRLHRTEHAGRRCVAKPMRVRR